MGRKSKGKPKYNPPTIIELGEGIEQADALAAACTPGSNAFGTGGCYAGSAATGGGCYPGSAASGGGCGAGSPGAQ